MATVRSAWGIDIGNRALKAIKLVREDGTLRVADFEVVEHETVLSNAGDNREALIQASLAQFVQRHQTKGSVTAISVSGVSSFARFIKLPPVEPKKIPEIVRFEAIQQIPFPLSDVEWSYQLFQTPDSPDVEVGIFAMRRDLVDQQIKHFTDVDLNVQCVQMNPLAVYNAMYHDKRLGGTTMIVDLGAENTDLIIADGETIWMRSIPIGGNNFTDVLVKNFKLSFSKAEELKRNANTSKYARQIFSAMRPIFADLVAEIQRSIGFYASVHRESRIKKIMALGGTFRLAGLQKYLQQNLQLEVEKLGELAAGAPEDAKAATTFNANLLSLVSAYGLALQAMNETKVSSSLLPMRIRREKMWRDKTKWFATAAAAFVLGAGVAVGGYFYQQIQWEHQQDNRAYIKDTLAESQRLSGDWNSKVQGEGEISRRTITNVRDMLAERYLWIDALQDMFSALPPLPKGYADNSKDELLKEFPVRGARPVIFVDKVTSQYSASLASNAIDLRKETLPAGARGYVVTVTVTTPNSNNLLFVQSTFVENLKKMNLAWMEAYNKAHPKDLKTYYFVPSAAPINQEQLLSDPARKARIYGSYQASLVLSGKAPPPTGGQWDPGAAAPAGGAVEPLPGAVAENPLVFVDPFTNEDSLQDWTMDVRFLIVINK